MGPIIGWALPKASQGADVEEPAQILYLQLLEDTFPQWFGCKSSNTHFKTLQDLSRKSAHEWRNTTHIQAFKGVQLFIPTATKYTFTQ